jgi:hypothetical protein
MGIGKLFVAGGLMICSLLIFPSLVLALVVRRTLLDRKFTLTSHFIQSSITDRRLNNAKNDLATTERV